MEYLVNLIKHYRDIRNRRALRQIYAGGYAFVGLGGHSTTNLYPVLDYLRVPVKYICCKSADKTRLIERKYRHVRATTSLDELLNDDEVKAVFVSATPESHFEIASRVLKSGKSLFVEKPPCRSATELKTLIDKEKLYGSPVAMVGMQKRFSPSTRVLMGELQKASGMSYNLKYLTGLYPEGDVLVDLFIHPLDYACFLFGEAEIKGLECVRSKSGALTLLIVLKHVRASGVMELSTAYSWTDAREDITVNTPKGMFVLKQMENLCFYPAPGSLFGIPREKIFRTCSSCVTLAGRNNFVPTLHNNQIYTQGYFDEIKSFVDMVEGKTECDIPCSLDAIEPTYRLIDGIRNLIR